MPDLTESFIYLNDDVLLGRPLPPDFFFGPAGRFATFRAAHSVGLPGSDDRPYLAAARTNQELLRDALGVNITHTLAHTPHPMSRSVLFEIEEQYAEAVRRTTQSPFRAGTDVSMLSSLAQHHGLATGRAYPATAEHVYVDLGHQRVDSTLDGLMRRDRDFLCLADNHSSALGDEVVTELLTTTMAKYYPVAAPWEKDDATQQ